MDLWRVLEVLGGFACIAGGILNKEFAPIGWVTRLIWGQHKRLPPWVADPFYLLLGAFFIYLGLTGK